MDTRTWLRYWRRAVTVGRLLRYIPFVRMVGLNGSMVTGTFRPESDIDLYIVTKDGHIFVGRTLVSSVLMLFGLRRKGSRIAGKVCDNRFAIESFVDITPHDLYHARVFHNLIPLFDDNGIYQKYCRENQWMQQFDETITIHQPLLGHHMVSFMIQRAGEAILGWPGLERRLEQVQQARFQADIRAHEPGSKVIISPRELRFHLRKELHG